MEGKAKREHWSGNIGFVLAAAGSAIGLGNIWKFPYITGENGGGAFVLVYLACICVIGIPVMLCEIVLGRHTQKNPVGAFRALTPKTSSSSHLLGLSLVLVGLGLLSLTHWGFGCVCVLLGLLVFRLSWTMVGFLGVFTGFVILSFYGVIAGWTLHYTFNGFSGGLGHQGMEHDKELLASILVDKYRVLPPGEVATLDRLAAEGRLSGDERKMMEEGMARRHVRKELESRYGLTPDPVLCLDTGLDRRGFDAEITGVLSRMLDGKILFNDVAAAYGGMETRAGSDGVSSPEMPKALKIALTGKRFSSFIDNPWKVIFYHFIFIAMCVGIVSMGVRNGIEKASKLLMPLLLLLVLALIVRGITLPGAIAGVRFYLSPDFSKLNPQSVLTALGHAFFSLSLGMGAMITYGSYMSKRENMFISTLSVVGLDTLMALLAGLAIFPAVFAEGFDPGQGPGLVFVTLPAVFNGMPMGSLWTGVFFLLLLVAALTSGVSLLEVVTAYFMDERKWNRVMAAVLPGIIIFLLGSLCALSFSDWERLKWLERGLTCLFGGAGSSFFEVLDNLGSNWFLPLGGLFTSLFVGWIWGTTRAVQEIRHGSSNFADVHLISLLAGLKDDPSHNCSEYHVLTLASMWGIFIRFISPVAVMIAFLHTVGWLKV